MKKMFFVLCVALTSAIASNAQKFGILERSASAPLNHEEEVWFQKMPETIPATSLDSHFNYRSLIVSTTEHRFIVVSVEYYNEKEPYTLEYVYAKTLDETDWRKIPVIPYRGYKVVEVIPNKSTKSYVVEVLYQNINDNDGCNPDDPKFIKFCKRALAKEDKIFVSYDMINDVCGRGCRL